MGIVSAFSVLVVLICAIIFYAVSSRHQWKVLLGGSIVYFGLVSPFGMAFVLANALISYLCAKRITKEEKVRRKKGVLLAEVVFFVFSWIITKTFFASTDNKILFFSTQYIYQTAVTLGCSYFVLRYISYAVDVYKGKVSPEKNFCKLLLYYCYFPVILQGPIERYHSFSQKAFQNQKIVCTYANVKNAGVLILNGLFKVYVISRFCAVFTSHLNQAEGVHGLILLLAIFLYSFQIFTDFSGGIDIVRGISYLFGLELSENFRRPYLSQSFSEFWKRWHMSFSAWLKDYVYIPLGGSQKGKIRGYINLAVVFVVSAVWHGFGLTFLFWGGLQALYVLTERLTGKSNVRNLEPAKIPLFQYLLNAAKVFLLSTFSWIFFNADSLQSVKTLFISILSSFRVLTDSGLGLFVGQFKENYLMKIGIVGSSLLISLLLLVISTVLCILKDRKGFDFTDSTQVCALVRWSYYIIVLILILSMGYYGDTFSASSFIYGGF